MGGSDEERSEVLKKFYEIYRPLQRRNNLRMYSHCSIYEKDDAFIEIWEYEGEKKVRNICRAKEENEIDCYRRAIDALEAYGKKGEIKEHEKRAG